MRYIKYTILLIIGLVLLTLSLANRGTVSLQLLPNDLAALIDFNYVVELPVFLVIFGGLAAGLLIGFIWEWLREHRHRAEAVRARAEAERLQRKLGQTGRSKKGEGDDVLALLEDGGKPQ